MVKPLQVGPVLREAGIAGVVLLLFAFVSVFIPSAFSRSPRTSVWTEEGYGSFTASGFKSFKPANEPIDFRDIDYPLLSAAIFFETNRMRLKHGREALRYSRGLEAAAFSHARDMALLGFFSHEHPFDSGKKTLFQRMIGAGIRGGHMAENIGRAFGIRYNAGSLVVPPGDGAWEFREYRTGRVIERHTYNSLAEAVVASWMRSPRHRENILDRNLRYLGSGAYHFSDREFHGIDMFMTAQNFASKAGE